MDLVVNISIFEDFNRVKFGVKTGLLNLLTNRWCFAKNYPGALLLLQIRN